MTSDNQNTESNISLPFGWLEIPLKDICIPIDKVKPADAPEDTIHYIDIGSIDNSKNTIVDSKEYLGEDAPSRARQVVQSGDVLFSTVRVYLKNIAQVQEKHNGYIASTGFTVIRPVHIVNKDYVFFYTLTQQFLKPLEKAQRGVSYPAVRDSDVFAQKIPLPPLNEQNQIVKELKTLLTNLDEGVKAVEHTQNQLKRYRKSILKSAIEGELSKEWREEYKGDIESASELLERISKERRDKWEVEELATMEARGKPPKNDKWKEKYKLPERLSDTKLPELPKHWVWTSLAEIGGLNRGKSKHRPRNDPNLYGGDYPFIQTGDVREADGVIRDYKQTYNELGLAQSKLWPKGTLCITIAANIAETAILGFDSCFPDSVVGFTTNANNCNTFYIEYFLRTARENLERYAPATAQKNINLQILGLVAVPFPPKAEQDFIVKELKRQFSYIKGLENNLDEEYEKFGLLKQSILTQAFEGKLAPQEKYDEPVVDLLSRIKEVQGAIVKGKGKKNKSNRGGGSVAKSKKIERKTIFTVLTEQNKPLTPEDVFTKAGFIKDKIEDIDAFYEELRKELGNRRIMQERPNNADVYLKAVQYEA